MMSSRSTSQQPDERPDFMVVLGLAPPYSVEDVKQAYLERAKSAHPDRGGNVDQFHRLQEAFERATEYVQFRASRMSWLAKQIEHYVAQEKVVEEIERRGGSAGVEEIDWLERSFGPDFAQVVEKVTAVRLRGPQIGDDAVDFLFTEHAVLSALRDLDLAGSRVTDDAALRLRVFTGLKRLDLSGTQVTNRVLELVPLLPGLEELNVRGTRVTWAARTRLRWSHANVNLIT